MLGFSHAYFSTETCKHVRWEQVYSCSLGAGRMVSFTPRLFYSRGQWPSVAAGLVVEWRADQVWMFYKTDSLVHPITHSIHLFIHSFIHSFIYYTRYSWLSPFVQTDLLRTAMKWTELKVPNLYVEILQARWASELLVKMVYIWHRDRN